MDENTRTQCMGRWSALSDMERLELVRKATEALSQEIPYTVKVTTNGQIERHEFLPKTHQDIAMGEVIVDVTRRMGLTSITWEGEVCNIENKQAGAPREMVTVQVMPARLSLEVEPLSYRVSIKVCEGGKHQYVAYANWQRGTLYTAEAMLDMPEVIVKEVFTLGWKLLQTLEEVVRRGS